MDVQLCKPVQGFLHDTELLKYWLWKQGCTSWKSPHISYNDFYDFYDVVLEFEPHWKEGLSKQLAALPNVSSIDWGYMDNHVRLFIKV